MESVNRYMECFSGAERDPKIEDWLFVKDISAEARWKNQLSPQGWTGQ